MSTSSSSGRAAALRDVVSRIPLLPKSPYPAPTSSYFGVNTFGARQMRDKLPKAVYEKLVGVGAPREEARPRDRAHRRAGDQGVGDLARRDALHALVPAADRPHRREARRVPHVRRRPASPWSRSAARSSSRASPTRRASRPAACARRGKRAATRRGTRRSPVFIVESGGVRDAVHSVGLHRLQRRSARRDDAAAPQLRRALREGDRAARAARRQGRAARLHDARARAGVFPHRPRALRAAPRPRDGRAARSSARRRRAASSSRITTSAASPSACRPASPRSSTSSTSSACRSSRATTRSRRASSRWRRCSRRPTSRSTTTSS